jgi:hypothetical protein
MESVEEENDESIDPANNFETEDSEDDLDELNPTSISKKLNAITASDKLGMTSFRFVTKNSCAVPNCEYSQDKVTVSTVRDGRPNRSQASDKGGASGHLKSI